MNVSGRQQRSGQNRRTRGSLSFYLTLLIGLIAMVPVSRAMAQVDDTIPTVAVTCPNCFTFAQLQARASSYLVQWANSTPPGHRPGTYIRACTEMSYDHAAGEPIYWNYPTCTTAIVISVGNPISGAFAFGLYNTDSGTAVVYPGSLQDTLDAMDFDSKTLGRATKNEPIPLPPNFGPGDVDEVLINALRSEIPPDPNRPLPSRDWGSVWSNFWTNFPDFELPLVYFFIDQQGDSVKVHLNGTVTVVYANGWTEKFQLINQHGSIGWQRVSGSLRDPQGKDPNAPTPTQPPSTQTGAGVGFQDYVGDFINVIPIFYEPWSFADRAGHVEIQQIYEGFNGGGDRTFFYQF